MGSLGMNSVQAVRVQGEGHYKGNGVQGITG